MRTRLRCFDRRLGTRTGAFPSILSLPQGPRKVRKASKASKEENRPRRKAFGRILTPFGRMVIALGEPRYDSSEWPLELKEMCLEMLETPNGAPFGRIGDNSGEYTFHSAEFKPQTARFLFFANRTPRAFRAFYPFCSLAYKYPSFL